MYQTIRIKINADLYRAGHSGYKHGWTLYMFDMAERRALKKLVNLRHPSEDVANSVYRWFENMEFQTGITTTRKSDAVKLAKKYADECGFVFDKDVDIHEQVGWCEHGPLVDCMLCGTRTSFRSHGNEPKFCTSCREAIELARSSMGEIINVAVEDGNYATMIAAVTGVVLDEKAANEYVSLEYSLGYTWRSGVKYYKVGMTRAQYAAAVKLYNAIHEEIDTAWSNGVNHGRNWLLQAARGEISIDDVDDLRSKDG